MPSSARGIMLFVCFCALVLKVAQTIKQLLYSIKELVSVKNQGYERLKQMLLNAHATGFSHCVQHLETLTGREPLSLECSESESSDGDDDTPNTERVIKK